MCIRSAIDGMRRHGEGYFIMFVEPLTKVRQEELSSGRNRWYISTYIFVERLIDRRANRHLECVSQDTVITGNVDDW